MKRVLITGVTGQDGSYLAELLIDKGYDVYGLLRRSSTDPLMRIKDLHNSRKLKLVYGNVTDLHAVRSAMEKVRPDEVYNLAAQSDVRISFDCPVETMEINYYGFGKVVNEAMTVNPKVRIYQASTSEMFGKTHPPQNEDSPFAPASPYGFSKLKAHEDFVVSYRQRHGLFVCSGILFNHESPRRGENFVTRKITTSLARVKLGLQDYFELGNLEAKRDWGFAGDYVEAMWLMLQRDKPEDFVVATGESHTVRDFVGAAAKALDMKINWQGEGLNEVGIDENGKAIIKINPDFYRPTEVDYLLGDSSRARKELGWKPKVNFNVLVAMMAKADLEKLERGIS